MSTARDVAAILNLRPIPGRSEWRGACPRCSYGTSLVLTERDGRPLWWCASCQDGKGVTTAIQQALRGDRPALSRSKRRTTPVPSKDSRSALARTLWQAAQPLPGTPAQLYLAARSLPGVNSKALRFHPRCPHPSGIRMPAMLAAVSDALTGELRAVHRTFLRPDGAAKARAEPNRASLGPVGGGVVMLLPPSAAAALVIAEGIETALSAAVLLHLPVAWSAISAGNLETLILPPLSEVVIAADPDATGQRAAWTAARRWRAEGRRVRVATPNASGADFNDLLRAKAASEVAHA